MKSIWDNSDDFKFQRHQAILTEQARAFANARELYRWNDWVILKRVDRFFVLSIFRTADIGLIKDDPECDAYWPLPNEEVLIEKSRDFSSFGEALKYASGQESIEGLIL